MGYGYDALTLLTLAQYIRNLGYRAYATMNDSALAVPLAAQAGLGEVGGNDNLSALLNAFANMAVVSSFLGVTLGLFDFIADRFKFDDSHTGRFKTALLTFLPPTLGGLFFPNGFIYAIGLAGLCATVWGVIVPALAVRASRQKFDDALYRVWGGNTLIYLLLCYGAVLIVCYGLAAFGILPVY